MTKPNLNALPAGERVELAALIQQYTTPEIVNGHWRAARTGVHSDPVKFLTFHREYIGGLERYLSGKGHSEWVPLPMWNPAEPIPEEFHIPRSGPGRLKNLNPQVDFSPRFSLDNLKLFASEEELGAALMGMHNRVHRRIGGLMRSQHRAPETAIFWPFHSFVDDIWMEWQRQNAMHKFFKEWNHTDEAGDGTGPVEY